MTTAPFAAAERPARRRLRRDTLAGLAMIAPAGIGLIAFVVVPFIGAVVFSLYNIRLGTARDPVFLGITQYARLFTDPDVSADFRSALANNAVFAAAVVPGQTLIALCLALLVRRAIRGTAFFRSVYFLPVIFPMALVAVIWRLILSRGDTGMANSVLSFVSGGAIAGHDWLGSSTTAMASVVVISMWQGAGFQMVILLAGLQQIPGELYEAAELDRASPWQQFRHVTLPGISVSLTFVLVYTAILSFKVFDQIYVLTRTGGGLNEDATQTVVYQAVRAAFDENNIGRGSAISVVFFSIIVILTVVQQLVVRRAAR